MVAKNMRLIPISMLLLLLCGIAPQGCTMSKPTASQTSQILPARIPIQIKAKATIGIVPVLYPEPNRKKDFYDYFLSPPDQGKYEQSVRYTAVMANKIKDDLEQKGFAPFVSTPARTEDLYAPEFFEVLKISCPADYCILIYLYELTDSEKKVGRTPPEKEGDSPVEQWQQDVIARSRIELYESTDMNLIWQYDITANTLLITEKKISGSKQLDDLAYSLIQPHYYEQINNEVILKTIQEMTGTLKSLSVNINPNHKVKTDIYLYDKKVSNYNLLKDMTITITGIIITKNKAVGQTGLELKQPLITDANGRISVELPEGFYQIEASIPAVLPSFSSSEEAGEPRKHSLQTLIIGDVRRINIILK